MEKMVNITLACIYPLLPNGEINSNVIYRTPVSEAEADSFVYPRLTVSPHQDATAPDTTEIEGLKGYPVHVPQKAVGKTRVSLILLLHGGGRNGSLEMAKFNDKYGVILLTGSSIVSGHWDVIGHIASQGSN